MCLPPQSSRGHRLLLTQNSFECYPGDNSPPTKTSSLMTIVLVVIFLFAAEHSLRILLKDAHYLLEDEMNTKIVARHLGVDFLALFTVSCIGFANRHIANDLWNSFFSAIGWKKDSAKAVNTHLHPSGFESRIFTYHPASQQLLLIFTAYQIKNLYDSIVFDDGIEFVCHHIFAGCAAWGAMHPGYAHFYSIFFMGISEISTTILILLSHFDEKFGIEGAAEAFPVAKVIIAVAFVTSFLICRTILWPYASYYFVKDALTAFRTNSPKLEGRRAVLKMAMFSLSGLSVLQVAWLYQIFVQAKEEIALIMG